MPLKKFWRLVLSLIIPQAAGLAGSIATFPSIPSWYALLAKPNVAPPNWVFGPVWTTLFVLMGIALYLVWNVPASTTRKKAFGIFGLQLLLNVLWSVIFFGLHSTLGASVEIIFLWLAIFWNIIVFYRLSRVAGYLLVPYILWVSFASYLTFSIWRLN